MESTEQLGTWTHSGHLTVTLSDFWVWVCCLNKWCFITYMGHITNGFKCTSWLTMCFILGFQEHVFSLVWKTPNFVTSVPMDAPWDLHWQDPIFSWSLLQALQCVGTLVCAADGVHRAARDLDPLWPPYSHFVRFLGLGMLSQQMMLQGNVLFKSSNISISVVF